MIYSQTLPDDYINISVPVKSGLKNVKLRALNPVDIIATKIGRLDGRDWEDIEACIRKFKLTKAQISKGQGMFSTLVARKPTEQT